MLFNLAEDISEQHDVSMQNLEITKSLLKRLGSWDISQPHPVFLEGAIWRKDQLSLYDRKYIIKQPE